MSTTPTPAEAHAMGRTEAILLPAQLEAERLAFEAWMEGHSWMVAGTWNGTAYDDLPGVPPGCIDTAAMLTRMLWTAWRDRAALAHHAAGGEVA